MLFSFLTPYQRHRIRFGKQSEKVRSLASRGTLASEGVSIFFFIFGRHIVVALAYFEKKPNYRTPLEDSNVLIHGGAYFQVLLSCCNLCGLFHPRGRGAYRKGAYFLGFTISYTTGKKNYHEQPRNCPPFS